MTSSRSGNFFVKIGEKAGIHGLYNKDEAFIGVPLDHPFNDAKNSNLDKIIGKEITYKNVNIPDTISSESKFGDVNLLWIGWNYEFSESSSLIEHRRRLTSIKSDIHRVVNKAMAAHNINSPNTSKTSNTCHRYLFQ